MSRLTHGMRVWGAAAMLLMHLEAASAMTADSGSVLDALPDEANVRAALEQSPRLRIAHEAISVGAANEQKLRAGPHEWELATMTQRRTDPNGQRYSEQEYGLQRGMRWPWKVGIDRRLGSTMRQAGELRYADAWHEAGRDLLDLWFAWRDADQVVQLLDAQLQTLQKQQAAVARRVEAGDAAALELQLATAETQRIQAQRHTVALTALQAREALLKEFPALQLPPAAKLVLPAALPESDEVWLARITADNHELELAQALAEEAQIGVERAARNRLADPKLALNYSDNLDGNRRLLGLTATMPLGGRARSADLSLARSGARAATSAAQQVSDSVLANARAAIAGARLSFRGWQELSGAAQQMQQTADATARGYALGEYDIATLLAVRRQALEVQREAEAAQLGALRAYARVLLDAHQLWALPHHEEDHEG